jgi:hypothetical protein
MVGLAITGCAQHIYSSGRLDSDKMEQGIAYALPKAVLPLKISVVERGLQNATPPEVILELGAPHFIADEAHLYRLKRRANAANSDTLKVGVDPETLFLTKVETTSTGDIDATLRNAAKSAAALLAESRVKASKALPAKLIFDGFVDPAMLQSTVRNELKAYQGRRAKECKGAICRRQREAWTFEGIQIGMKEPLEGRSKLTADCSIGVCYRNKAPRTLVISLGGATTERIINIPNGEPLLVFPLRRPIFADSRKTDLSFTGGFLHEAALTRPSEAKEAALLPFNIVGGAIEGVAGSLVKLKIDENAQQKAFLDSQKALNAAREALQEESKPQDGLLFCGSSYGRNNPCSANARDGASPPVAGGENAGLPENPK